MLVEDKLRACGEYFTVAWREETAEHWSQTYHSLVLRGKIRTAVWWITKLEMSGVLQPGDRCTKTGDRVMEMLRAKHLEAQTPTEASLELYPDHPLELTPVDIIDDTLTAVAGRFSGGAGLGGQTPCPSNTGSCSSERQVRSLG